MDDQANYLRRLVRQGGRGRDSSSHGAPRLVGVLGGKGGVGATSLAMNLSLSLAQQGQRVVLVDADLSGANVHALCSLADGPTVADVLKGHHDVHEALQPGPGGIQVLPGAWASGELFECSAEAQDRLFHQLRGLNRFVETVVLDVGNGLNPSVRRFVEAVDTLLLVTTPDPVSVMDSYAAIKLLLLPDCPAWVAAAVNQVPTAKEANEIYGRLALCCRRFLGRRLHWGGWIPPDEQVAAALARQEPLLLSAPDSLAAAGVNRIASDLLAAWELAGQGSFTSFGDSAGQEGSRNPEIVKIGSTGARGATDNRTA